MVDLTNKCKANETTACCGVDIGVVIDNEDCSANYEAVFKTQQEAEEALSKLTDMANNIASDPCQITHQIEVINDSVKLTADFNFCCAAESMIFQFKLR